jgi:hypothetical protein
MTGTGTSGTINGEVNLTFNGSVLTVTGQQDITDASGTDTSSLEIVSTTTAADPLYSVEITNTGNGTTTTDRQGIRATVTGGSSRNFGGYFDVTYSKGANTGVYVINNSTTAGSTQRGYYASLTGTMAGGTKPTKVGLDVTLSGTADLHYGLSADISSATQANYGVFAAITGTTGNNAIVYGNNNSVTSAAGDLQYGAYLTVDGSGSASDTLKYGIWTEVLNQAAINYGVYSSVSGSTTNNYAGYLLVSGVAGDGYGLYVSNSNTPASGDNQYGAFLDVNGIGSSTTTFKYGGYVTVTGDARENYALFLTASGATNTNWAIYAEAGSVKFNANSTTTSDFQVQGSTAPGLFVDVSANRVGINTVSPDWTLDVNGAYQFVHDPTTELSTSVSGYGDIVTFGTGTVSAGNLYYLNGSGAWTAADADAESTSTGMLAIALGATVGAGMLVRGYVRNSSWTQATGDILYVSQTAGGITSTAPSASGTVIRIVGYMINATSDQIYFNPSNDWTTN